MVDKTIGCTTVQINPVTFSKAYWLAVIGKLCYGLFLIMNTDDNLMQELEKLHVDFARNIFKDYMQMLQQLSHQPQFNDVD